jgi:hypothetical protein
VVLMGSFEEAFLEIPDAVIRATIRDQPEMLRAARSGNHQQPCQQIHAHRQHRAAGWRQAVVAGQ